MSFLMTSESTSVENNCVVRLLESLFDESDINEDLE